MSNAPESTESDVTEDAIEQPEDAPQETEDTPEDDTFSREYVEKLREENAKLRVRAQSADETRHRLHRALIDLDGRLADSGDLPYDDSHLEPEALTAAIDDLLTEKPHLKNRTPKGDVGQGNRGAAEPTSLLNILRNFT